MNVRARVRRAFPYLVIAVVGFALAYIVIFIFVFPSKIVPNARPPYVRDTSQMLEPIDPGVIPPTPDPVGTTLYIPPAAPIPMDVPNLVGMALPDARGMLNTLQLNIAVRDDTSSFDTPNTVLRQSPQPGAKVSEHGTVFVTVSRLPTAADTIPPRHDSVLPPIQLDSSDTTQ